MTREGFLAALRQALAGLPQEDIEERLSFYAEMIDDRMEEGLSEEEAVAAVGSVDEIVAGILEETPLRKIVKEKIRPKRRAGAWEIVLLVLGAPLWLPLLIAFITVLFSLYLVLWSLVAVLWSVFAAFAVTAVVGVPAGIVFLVRGHGLTALAAFGVAAVFAGLSVFMFFACRAATKGLVLLTGSCVRDLKKRFVGKEKPDA